jgi:NAD(P)-dependent dehydrogenase (short-subunit alcohol dehydrogenase family)
MGGGLEGRVALVTGSSRGIGRAVAAAYVEQGALVILNSRHQDEVERAAAELGRGAVAVAADVSSEDGARQVIEEAVRLHGRLDVLVNNAGTTQAGPSLDLGLDEWRRVIDLNLTGTFLCSQQAARTMLAGDGGVIINTASIQSFSPFPRRLAYGTSKAAVVMMTRILAAEWAPRIRVNAVAPGYVRTRAVDRLEAEGRIDAEAIRRRTPQGRMAQPEDVAGAFVYLASDAAAFVTGETLLVDGGWTAFGAFEGI